MHLFLGNEGILYMVYLDLYKILDAMFLFLQLEGKTNNHHK